MPPPKLVFNDLLDWLLIKEVESECPNRLPRNKDWSTIADCLKNSASRLFSPPPSSKILRERVEVLLDRYDNTAMGQRSMLTTDQTIEMDNTLQILSGLRKEVMEKKAAAAAAKPPAPQIVPNPNEYQEPVSSNTDSDVNLSKVPTTPDLKRRSELLQSNPEYEAKKLKLTEEKLKIKKEALALKKEELAIRKQEISLQRERETADREEREKRMEDDRHIRSQLLSMIRR